MKTIKLPIKVKNPRKMKRLLYFLREENYVTVRKNDVNEAFMLLYEKYSSFIFLSYFTPHHPFQ